MAASDLDRLDCRVIPLEASAPGSILEHEQRRIPRVVAEHPRHEEVLDGLVEPQLVSGGMRS